MALEISVLIGSEYDAIRFHFSFVKKLTCVYCCNALSDRMAAATQKLIGIVNVLIVKFGSFHVFYGGGVADPRGIAL